MHEAGHVYDRDLSPDAARDFITGVVIHKGTQSLLDRGYPNDLVELASEFGAHARAADWSALDVTPEQGKASWEQYKARQPGGVVRGPAAKR